MNYWIFKANPTHYNIDGRLNDPDPVLVWMVSRYLEKIQHGDTVFIWRTGNPRGICAVMLIEECPYALQKNDYEGDGYETPGHEVIDPDDKWTKATITRRFKIIETSEIKLIKGLEHFSFSKLFNRLPTSQSPQARAKSWRSILKKSDQITGTAFLHINCRRGTPPPRSQKSEKLLRQLTCSNA